MQILTNTGPLAATGVVWSANVADLDSVSVKVNAIVGSTITVEGAPDNATWTTITTGGEAYDAAGNVTNNAGVITAAGRYRFPADVNYIRFRVSTYVGPGNVDIEIDYSTETPRKLTRMLVTGLVSTGTSSQAAALPIQGRFNQFATVAANSGTILPSGLSKTDRVKITNGGANALLVYPPVGNAINGGSTNASNSLAVGASAEYVSDGAGNFWRF